MYFGLDQGFNARGRASNFGLDDLSAGSGPVRIWAGSRPASGYGSRAIRPWPATALAESRSVLAPARGAGMDTALAQTQSAAALVPKLLARGVRRFRVATRADFVS